MELRPLRIAYAVEFLLALMVFFECWSQIGGQTPIDLMPWWLKSLFALGFAYLVCRITAASVRNEPFPPVPLLRWSLALIGLLVLIGLSTYYFYEHAPSDDETDDSVTNSALVTVRPSSNAYG